MLTGAKAQEPDSPPAAGSGRAESTAEPQAPADPQATAPRPYVDQLIDPDSPASAAALREAAEEAVRDTPGLDATLIEGRLYHFGSSAGTSLTESGILFQHRRETLNHGDWLLEGSGLLTSNGTNPVYGGSADRRRARFQLQQVGLPIRDDLQMTNAIGLIRLPSAGSDDYLSRFALPGAFVAGASSRLDRPLTTVYGGIGESARLDGGQGLGWSSTGGVSAGGGWRYAGREGGRASVDLASLRGDRFARDNTTAALTLGRDDRSGDPLAARPPRYRWQYRLLADDERHVGHNLDARYRSRLGVWTGSLWTFDPGLHWYNTLLSSGQKGAALRYDHADPSLFWGLGGERTRDRPFVDGAPALESAALHGSVGTRIGLGRAVGLSGQWRRLAPRDADAAAAGFAGTAGARSYRSTNQSLSTHFNRSVRDYSDRWQLSWVSNRSPEQRSNLYEATWNADRVLEEGESLGGFVGIGYQLSTGAPARWRPTAGLSWATQPADRWQLTTYLRYARDLTADLTSYSWSGSARASYQFSRHWQLSIDGGLNQGAVSTASNEPLFATIQKTRQRDRTFWLSVRYQDAGGTPYAALTGSGRRGAGSIGGVVFQDENGDGIRQADERPAANVSLTLDNGVSVKTDAAGRFVFPIAGTGSRRLVVDPESIRLPWGVASETPRTVSVNLREQTTLDIPLVRIGE